MTKGRGCTLDMGPVRTARHVVKGHRNICKNCTECSQALDKVMNELTEARDKIMPVEKDHLEDEWKLWREAGGLLW